MASLALTVALAAVGAHAQGFGQTSVPFGPVPMGCSKFEILVARGTSEPGPFGIVTGDPLITALTKKVPGSRGYAVQYPASFTNDSVPTGVNDVMKRIMGQDKACPDQKFALMGYSQGALVMHQAVPMIPEAIRMKKILALVMFGDPNLEAKRMGKPNTEFPMDMQARLFENCAVGDPVCSEGPTFDPHLSYSDSGSKYLPESEAFIAAAFAGKPLPAKTTGPDPAQAAPATMMPGTPGVPMSMSMNPNMPMPAPTMPMSMPMPMSMDPNMPMPTMSMNMPMTMSMGMSMSMDPNMPMPSMSMSMDPNMPMPSMDPNMPGMQSSASKFGISALFILGAIFVALF